MTMPRSLKLILKIVLTWLLLSIGGFMWGSELIRWSLPASQWLIDQSPYPFLSHLKVRPTSEGDIVELVSFAKNEIPLLPNMGVPANTQISSSVHILHAIAPVVVLLTLTVCLPANTWKRKARLIIIGLLIAVMAMVASTPVLLIGKTQMYIQAVIEAAKLSRPDPFVVRWTLFWEVGGIWLAPLLFIIGGIAPLALSANSGRQQALQ